MKGRVNSMLWWLVGGNALVLVLVLCFSYGAGARSGGLRLRDFSILPQIAGFELLGATFLVVAATIVLFVWLDTKIARPVTELADFSERLAAGDVEAHASVTPDDFGVIAENLNRTSEVVARIRSLETLNEVLTAEMAEIEKSFAQLGRGELNARLRVSVDALNPLAQGFNVAVEALLRRVERVRTAAAEVTGAANSCFVASAANAAAVAEAEQNTAAVLPGIEELAASGRQACADADAAAEASCRALSHANDGNRAVRETADGMQRLRATMQTTAAKIKNLGDRSLQIYDIINIIHETNLLALNAVLSATRGSGVSGGAQPLETLAAEMSRLADHSRESTREIVTLLKSIQAESNEAVVVMEEANRVAETGSRLSEQASKAFAGIASLLQQTADLANAISSSSRRHVEAVEATRCSVQALAGQALQNVAQSQEAALQAEQLTRLCEQLTQTLAQFRTGPAVVKPELITEVPAAAATSA